MYIHQERQGKHMKVIGNIIWFLLGGLFLALLWFIAGLLLCITIIGIPFGTQCFKIAGLAVWPIGKNISYSKAGVGSIIGNILWILVFGWGIALTSVVVGLIQCITIIGIPFGLQSFKLAALSFMPFGASF